MDMKEVFKMIMSQNSMLKKELADLKKKVEDSNKERARDFKEADRPKPPTTTAPPSLRCCDSLAQEPRKAAGGR